jgi:hypothetical protein
LIVVALIAGIAGCVPAHYTLTISSTEGGTVTTPSEGTFTYDEGTVVNLVATPDADYRFVNWTGDVGTIANVTAAATNITMSGSYSITARFELDSGKLFAGGTGTEEDPYQIVDWHHLSNIRYILSTHYSLMNNLDSTTPGYEELASPTANGGKGWAPIGNFTGTLDGRGYEIRDLFINRPDEADVGLFGYVDEGGVIKDIGVMNIAVTGNSFVGGLVGGNNGTVSNSYSSATVTGSNLCIGGLVGGNNGTVSNSYSTSSVTGNSFVGGLVGGNNGTVSNSYSTSSVTGNSFVGGLVGVNIYSTVSYSTVSNSYACGNVTGTFFVGGLLGGNAGTGNVSNSYSTGNVTGNSSVGGLAGLNLGTVSNSYSTGNVTGDSYVGGLVGRNNEEGTVTNSFWDTQTSGQATSAGGTGKTTLEMKDFDTFDGVGWDIILIGSYAGETWYIDDGNDYPRLGWQL